MNEEILRLIATANFSEAEDAVNQLKEKVKGGVSVMVRSFEQISKRLGPSMLKGFLDKDDFKGLIAKIKEVGGELSRTMRFESKKGGMLASFSDELEKIKIKASEVANIVGTKFAKAFAKGSAKDLNLEYQNLVKRVFSLKAGTEEYRAAIVKSLQAVSSIKTKYAAMIASVEKFKQKESEILLQIKNQGKEKLKLITTDNKLLALGKLTQEIYKRKVTEIERLVKGGIKNAALVEMAKKRALDYLQTVKKLTEEEEKITLEIRSQNQAAEAFIGKNKNLMHVAGVIFNTKSKTFLMYKNIQKAVMELKAKESDITRYYDKQIDIKRKSVALLGKQKASSEIIIAVQKQMIALEKKRNKELLTIRNSANNIRRILEGAAMSGKGTKRHTAEAKKLAAAYHKAAKSVSSMGLMTKELGKNTIRLGGATSGLMRVFSRWRNRILVMTFAMAGFIRSMKRFIELAAQTQKETAALATVAFNTGTSIKKVTNAVGELAKDGIFSISAITQALKSLISMGINVDMAVKAIDTFKDSILANGRATLSMDEALTTGVQGLKEFRSQVSDNLGVMKNLDQILKENPDLVKKYGQATALLIGFMKEAAQFEGARVKVLEMLSGKMMTLTQRITVAKKALGEMLEPIAQRIIDTFMGIMISISTFVSKNKELLKSYTEDVGIFVSNAIIILKEFGKTFFVLIKDVLFILGGIISGIAKFIAGMEKLGKTGKFLIKTVALIIINLKIMSIYMKKMEIQTWRTFAATPLVHFMSSLTKLRMRYGSFTNAIIVHNVKMGASLTKLAASFKAMWASTLGPLVVFMAVVIAVEKLVGWLIKVHQQKKAIVALDRERASLARTIMKDTEELSRVLEALERVKGFQDYNIKIQELEKSLESLLNKRKEIMKEIIPLFPAAIKGIFGGGYSEEEMKKFVGAVPKDLSERLEKYQEQLKETKMERESFIELHKEEFIYLEKMGIVLDEVTDKFQIMSSTGKVLFGASRKEAQIWLDTMLEFEGKMTGLTRLREHAMKTAAKTEGLLAEAIAKRQEISQIQTETKLVKYFNTYIKKTKDATDAAKEHFRYMEDIRKQIKDVGEFRDASMQQLGAEAQKVIELTTDYNKFTKQLEEVKDKYLMLGKDPASQQEVKDLKEKIEVINSTIAGLSDEAKAVIQLSNRYDKLNVGLKEIEGRYKGLLEVLGAWAKTIDVQIASTLEGFNEKIKEIGEGFDKTIKDARRQSKLYVAQIKIVQAQMKDPSSVAAMKLNLSIENATAATKQKIADINEKHKKQVKDIKKELEGARQAILKMEEGDVARRTHLDKILELEILLGELADDKKNAIYAQNEALKYQIKLMEETAKAAAQQRAKQLIEDLKARRMGETSLVGIITGGGREQGARYRRTQKVQEMLRLTDLTKELRGSLKVEEDYLLNQTNDFWYNYGDIIQKGLTTVLNSLWNYYHNYRQTMKQIEETRLSNLAVLQKQNELEIGGLQDYEDQKSKINADAERQEKIAGLRAIQNASQQIQQMLAAKGIEWAIMAFAQKAMATAKAAEALPGPLAIPGHLAAAALYTKLAIAAGVGALAAGGAASVAGTAAAKLEREQAAAGVVAGEGGIGTTRVSGPQASTFGSTIQGQPQNVYINPTVTFSGDYIYLGDTVEEVGEKMSQVIVTTINDAVSTGDINFQVGSA